ncbi:PHP domain-containing protein [Aliikangiella sp. IMCC44653]
MNKRFDFHCHSNFSDGALTPTDLVQYAVAREIDYLALTDHDSVSGIDEALAAAEKSDRPIQIIAGVEISALTEFGEVHIVGLKINPSNTVLNEALKLQQNERWQRAALIEERLVKAGVTGVLEACKASVKQVVTRSHIAQIMVELNFVKDRQQAFKKYIGKQARIKIPKQWMSLEDAIHLIKQAGGVSVLAHPTRYPLSNRKLSYLIKAFSQAGGDAIELAYPSLTPDKMNWLKIQLNENQLLASSGSDFHYPNLKWTDLGRFPYLDSEISHVKEILLN